MLRLMRILLHFWKAGLMQAMEYRAGFLIGMFANTCDFTFGLIQYVLFFSAAKSIAGWETSQMLTLYAIFMTMFSLHFIFLYPNLEAMSRLVNRGELDLALLKPASAQVILSFRHLSFDEFGSFLASQALLLSLLVSGSISPSWHGLAGFGVAVVCGLSFIYASFLILMSLTIIFEKMHNTADLLWSLFSLTRYPVDVYPRWMRSLFLAVIPIGFISSVPASMLTRGSDWPVLLTGVGLSIVFLVLARRAWVAALRGYCSAGG
ncbi:MAG TPA: ABC-2 family transporter protein [Candidatus Ozemobacteraceae bacterium]|nr:ABC-2 family transporter protein [Candidatus Ozemobacteraceae bacterium]